MKKFLKTFVIVLVASAAILIAGTVLQMLAMYRQASRLIERSDSLALGCIKAEVLAAMPNDLLVSTNPPTADESAKTESAVTALRYNAPVLLNSVYVLMLFDDKDQLIAKRRFD